MRFPMMIAACLSSDGVVGLAGFGLPSFENSICCGMAVIGACIVQYRDL